MKKIILTLILLLFYTTNTYPWYLSCQGSSCTEREGGIEVGYTQGEKLLNSVSGLPIRLENFESAESKIVEMFNLNKTGGAEELTKGRRGSIDDTLNFVHWLGEIGIKYHTIPPEASKIFEEDPIRFHKGIVMSILQLYRENRLTSFIDTYFFEKRVRDMDKINIGDINANKFLRLVKFNTITHPFYKYDTDLSDGFIISYFNLSHDLITDPELKDYQHFNRVSGEMEEFYRLKERGEITPEKLFLMGHREMAWAYQLSWEGLGVYIMKDAAWKSYTNEKAGLGDERKSVRKCEACTPDDIFAINLNEAYGNNKNFLSYVKNTEEYYTEQDAKLKAEEEAKTKKTPKKKPIPVSNPKPKNGGVK